MNDLFCLDDNLKSSVFVGSLYFGVTRFFGEVGPRLNGTLSNFWPSLFRGSRGFSKNFLG